MKVGHNIADLVVILKTLPVLDAIQGLGAKIVEELVKMDSNALLVVEPNESGFDIINTSTKATVRILMATIMPNLRKLDPKLHLSIKLIQRHLSAIRHSRWFDRVGKSDYS